MSYFLRSRLYFEYQGAAVADKNLKKGFQKLTEYSRKKNGVVKLALSDI